MIRVDYNGESFYPFDPANPVDIDGLFAEAKQRVVDALALGKFYDEEADEPSQPLSGVVQRRLAAQLLGTYADRPKPGQRPERGPVRWVIPDLWRWGYIPMLGGSPKAGKTTFAIDLLAAVMNGPWEGTRFLDHFDVTQVTQDELEQRPVWYINAENPPDAVEEAMEAVDLGVWLESGLIVEHLEDLGGAETFDLTDPANYAEWEYRFTLGTEGFFDEIGNTPLLVIVDGLTAVLGGSAARYGSWYARFRALMRSLGIPNALVLAHSVLAGDHLAGGFESQAGPDGNWNLERTKSGKRLFSLQARTGTSDIARTEIRSDPDGRLRLGGIRPATALGGAPSGQPATSPVRDLQADVLAYVIANYSEEEQRPSANQTRGAVRGRSETVDAAAAELVKSGRIEQYVRTKQGGGSAYRPVLDPR